MQKTLDKLMNGEGSLYGNKPIAERSFSSLVKNCGKVCVALFATYGLLSQTPQAHADTTHNVGFVGDSISYGMGMSGPYNNGGIVGSGISTGNPKINEEHWQQFKSPLTIVEIGTNDFRYKGGENYKKLLDKYIAPLGDQHSLCIVQIPVPEEKRQDIRSGVLKLKPVLEEWAHENGIKIVDFPHFDSKERAPDGLHFNANAYKRMAQEVVEACQVSPKM